MVTNKSVLQLRKTVLCILEQLSLKRNHHYIIQCCNFNTGENEQQKFLDYPSATHKVNRSNHTPSKYYPVTQTASNLFLNTLWTFEQDFLQENKMLYKAILLLQKTVLHPYIRMLTAILEPCLELPWGHQRSVLFNALVYSCHPGLTPQKKCLCFSFSSRNTGVLTGT